MHANWTSQYRKSTWIERRLAQERYKSDFDVRLRKTRGFKVWEGAFLDISDPVKKTDKLSHHVPGTNKIFSINRGTTLIQRDEVTEHFSLDHLGRTPTSAKPLRHDTDATPSDIANKKRSGQTWVFSHLSDHAILRNGQTKFRVHWPGGYDPTWEPRDNVPEEAISRYFAQYHHASPRVGTPTNQSGASPDAPDA